jgi:hypothetical protein
VRQGLALLCSVFLGCSAPGDRPGAEAWPRPPVVSGAARDGDQPSVLFRCEEGRLGAYLVPRDSGTEGMEEQLVPITLDSSPSC